jgi:hypothetical protein
MEKILTIVVLLNSTPLAIDVTPIDTGAVFQRIGTVNTGFGYATLHIPIDIDILRVMRNQMVDLNKVLQGVHLPGEVQAKYFQSTNWLRSWVNSTVMTTVAEMDQAIFEFDVQVRDLNEGPMPVEHHREKRQFVVAAVGAIIGGFVVYEADQIHQKQLLNMVAEKQEVMTHTIEKNMIRLNQHDRDIKMLNLSIAVITKEIGRMILGKETMNTKMIVLQTSYALTELGRKNHKIVKSIEDARAGKFSLSVVDFRALKMAMRDLANQGSQLGKKLAIQSVLQLQDQPTSFILKDSVVHLFVHIPYASTDQELVLLRYLAAPVKPASAKPSDMYIEVDVRDGQDLLAVSKDETRHQLMTQADLQSCRRRNQVYYCSNSLMYKTKHESCLHGLYRNDPGMVARHCQMTLANWVSKTLRVNETTVMAIETNETLITLDCDARNRERITIQGSYLLTVPVGCTLSSPTMTVYRPENNVEVSLPGLMVTNPFSLELPGEPDDWRQAVEELTSHVGEKIPLSQIKGLMAFKAQMKTAESKGWIAGLLEALPHSLVTFFVVVIVVLVIYMVIKCLWKRRKPKQHSGAPGVVNIPLVTRSEVPATESPPPTSSRSSAVGGQEEVQPIVKGRQYTFVSST